MDFRTARKHMVESQVRTNDVTDLRIQAALERVPREAFLPEAMKPLAYVERDIEYAPGRRMINARDFSKLLAAATPEPGDLVLDAACGSGYATAVLAALSEMVVAVESDETLAASAQAALAAVGADNSAVIVGDPAKGAENQGPFDVILVASGVIETQPAHLLAQLKEGGRLAALMRDGGVSRGMVWRKDGGQVSARAVFDAATSIALPEFRAPKKFTF